MFDKKTIGEAKYLKKGSGDYIPFRMELMFTNCDKINEMLGENPLQIWFITKDTNK